MESIGADLRVMPRVPLADEHVSAIRSIATENHYRRGERVAEVGEVMNHFIYVLEGEIEVVDPYSDQRLLESTLGPTQFMGDLSFLNAGTYMLPMRAAQATKTLEVPRADMLALMADVPELSDHIIRVFAARRRRTFEENRSSIKVIGADRDAGIQRVASFLDRNRIPYQAFDLDAADQEGSRLCNLADHEPSVIFAQDQVIDDPSPRKIAQLLGLDLDISDNKTLDLVIVGGGPAGVAAAVYAGSEGLDALVIEDTAIGGQAGTSSRIENYMGFPTGIAGADLVYRGQIQALKFGTRFAMPRRVQQLTQRDDGCFVITVDDGDEVAARAVLVATGVQYRHLPLERLEDFEGAGVFYAATEMEARFCRNTETIVVGGGNSAGQAAMYLSRVAKHVHMLVRGDTLADSMSSYLSRRLEADDKVTIHYHTEVEALHGEDWLQGVTIAGPDESQRIETSALFIMIGAAPHSEWLSGMVDVDDNGFVKTGDQAGTASPFQTSHPGIYAVGDVRMDSVKRVASAVGEGSVVVSAIWSYLNQDSTGTD